MTAPLPFLAEISQLIDDIETALINQSPETVQSLCAQLQQTLQSRVRSQDPELGVSTENRLLAQAIDNRLATLRRTLLQQGAAAERALAALAPDLSVGAYGDKSGFGQAARGTHRKSFLA